MARTCVHVRFCLILSSHTHTLSFLIYTLTIVGRFDLRIPDFVVDELKLTTVLEPLLSLLRSIMTVGKKAPELQTHNVVFVPVGSKEQV